MEKDGEAGPSTPSRKKLSDFERTFRPFSVKKGAELAPINWFHESRKTTQSRKGKAIVAHHVEGNVIVIDDEDVKAEEEDVEMTDLSTPQHTSNLAEMTTRGMSGPHTFRIISDNFRTFAGRVVLDAPCVSRTVATAAHTF